MAIIEQIKIDHEEEEEGGWGRYARIKYLLTQEVERMSAGKVKQIREENSDS